MFSELFLKISKGTGHVRKKGQQEQKASGAEAAGEGSLGQGTGLARRRLEGPVRPAAGERLTQRHFGPELPQWQ